MKGIKMLKEIHVLYSAKNGLFGCGDLKVS